MVRLLRLPAVCAGAWLPGTLPPSLRARACLRVAYTSPPAACAACLRCLVGSGGAGRARGLGSCLLTSSASLARVGRGGRPSWSVASPHHVVPGSWRCSPRSRPCVVPWSFRSVSSAPLRRRRRFAARVRSVGSAHPRPPRRGLSGTRLIVGSRPTRSRGCR